MPDHGSEQTAAGHVVPPYAYDPEYKMSDNMTAADQAFKINDRGPQAVPSPTDQEVHARQERLARRLW